MPQTLTSRRNGRILKSVRAFALAALALLLALPASAATAAKKPTRVQKLARSLVAAHAPGAIVFVRTPTRTRSGVAGASQLQPRVAMKPNMHYRIASVTKTFVATVVLQLVGEGKLTLDDPIERWLPGLVPNGSAITVRELLSHTSGLFNYTDDLGWQNAVIANPGREWSPRELLAIAFSKPPLFAPGTNWSYSNTGYILLGLMVEAITGEPVANVLKERIFDPLALRATSFPTGIAMDEPFAHGYLSFAGSLVDLAPILNPSWGYAAGQIVSTAADVTKFLAALLGGKLLSPALMTQMKAGSAASSVYGLGMRTSFAGCGRIYGHDGSFFGWRNEAFATANGRRAAVVMVNVDDSRIDFRTLEGAVAAAVCTG
jgi:D-alanyl-D-alanine carboxypeptidase